ncbi:hypothetical protein ACFE04_023918 [Oxalis oulophora]
MELQLMIKKNTFLDLAKRKRKWVFLFTAFGFTSYGLYRFYHSPSTDRRRRKLLKVFQSLVNLSEAISNSAESISVVSKDFKGFIQSESDEIPNSFIQMSKISNSTEFANSIITLTQALTLGILRGQKSVVKRNNETSSSLFESVTDKLFTTAGSGFASVIVGSFARNLVMGYYSCNGEESNSNSIDKWVDHVASNEKLKELIGGCIQLFVSTMVAVFLDNTMHINTYDQFFAGLTNPDHEERVKDMLVSVCNGAVETFMKTSNDMSRKANYDSNWSPFDIDHEHCDEFEESLTEFEEVKADKGWNNKVLSCKNKRFFLDMTGKVTYETVRSLVEYFAEKLNETMRRFMVVVHETVLDSGRYVTAKTSVIATVFLSVCLHIVDSAWILVPA